MARETGVHNGPSRFMSGEIIVVPCEDAKGVPIPLSLTADVIPDREPVWNPKGKPQVFTHGRVNWSGRDSVWKDAPVGPSFPCLDERLSGVFFLFVTLTGMCQSSIVLPKILLQ